MFKKDDMSKFFLEAKVVFGIDWRCFEFVCAMDKMVSIKRPSRLNPSDRCLTVMGAYNLIRCGPQGFSLCRQSSLFTQLACGFEYVFVTI